MRVWLRFVSLGYGGSGWSEVSVSRCFCKGPATREIYTLHIVGSVRCG